MSTVWKRTTSEKLRLRVSGFVTEFELGRQAAWRPRGDRGGVVKTLMALCILLLCCGCVSRILCAGFEPGRQAAWRPRCNRGGVGKTVVGTVHSAVDCGCVSLGGNHVGVVKTLVTLCSLLVICDCVLLGLCMRGSSSVVKLLGGRGAIRLVLSN